MYLNTVNVFKYNVFKFCPALTNGNIIDQHFQVTEIIGIETSDIT